MRVEKNWGYEIIEHNGKFCCKQLVYTRPVASSVHYHREKHEVFVVASGKFIIEVGPPGVVCDPYTLYQVDYARPVGPGFSIDLPPNTLHRVRCLEPGFIVEASTHDDPEDCVRLIPSEP